MAAGSLEAPSEPHGEKGDGNLGLEAPSEPHGEQGDGNLGLTFQNLIDAIGKEEPQS